MDSKTVPPDLRQAFESMQQQVEAAHRIWIEALIRHRPELAARLRALHGAYGYRNEQLEALLLLFVADPSMSIEGMYREYSGVLDAAEVDSSRYQDRANNGGEVGHRQRSGQTKRLHSQEIILSAGVRLVVWRRDVTIPHAASLAGVSVRTAYAHFPTREALLRAAYERGTSITKGRIGFSPFLYVGSHGWSRIVTTLNQELASFFGQVSRHIDDRTDEVREEVYETRNDLNRLKNTIDGIAKHLDDTETERFAQSAQLSYHEAWRHQAASKLGLKLDYDASA